MISGVREREIIQCATDTILDAKITSLPVDPKSIATSIGIHLQAWKPEKLGISGFFMRAGEQFGIGYSTAIENEGFINFTVGHELGHYFLGGHVEALIGTGDGTHYSKSGFVSDDKHEREADAFAAELLMPESLFKAALRKAGSGITAIRNLAVQGRTSLVATGIRYVKKAEDPVAVILSSGDRIEWCFLSTELRKCRGVFPLGKNTPLPVNSATARFNRAQDRVLGAETVEGTSSLRAWFDEAPDIEFQEDVIGLGHYGKTLTVLFTEEALGDEDEDEEEEDESETGLPSSRWRHRDETRRLD